MRRFPRWVASNEPHGPFPVSGARLAFAGLDVIHPSPEVDQVFSSLRAADPAHRGTK